MKQTKSNDRHNRTGDTQAKNSHNVVTEHIQRMAEAKARDTVNPLMHEISRLFGELGLHANVAFGQRVSIKDASLSSAVGLIEFSTLMNSIHVKALELATEHSAREIVEHLAGSLGKRGTRD